jgi:CheY-like chemotaxis protein
MVPVAATNAGEALTLLRSAAAHDEPFAATLVDADLMYLDGAEFARTARNESLLAPVKNILLARVDRARLPTDIPRNGVDAVLAKPIHPRHLLAALARVLLAPATPSALSAGTTGADNRGEADNQTPSGEPDLPTAQAPLRVLVAEDNVVNQRVAVLLLKKLGHPFHGVANGYEALAALEHDEYDLIMMDCQMPELDGYETTARIRQHLRHRDMWIIALTANAMAGDRERCLAAGMNDYLSKPMREAELSAALTRYRGARAARRDASGQIASSTS